MASAYGDDDYQPQTYQDDLNADDSTTDPLMDETGDDPTEDFGVPPHEFREELDKEYDEEDEPDDDDIDIHDDEREFIEDLDDQDSLQE